MSDFDGIKEQDNKLPTGWLIFYIAGIVWLIWYVFSFTPEISGWSFNKNFDAEMAAAKATTSQTEAAAPAGNPYTDNKAAIEEAEGIYASNCAGCHGAELKGATIGTDLRAALKYGESDEAIFESIGKGRPNGMPPFGAQLGTDRTWKLVAYISHERKDKD